MACAICRDIFYVSSVVLGTVHMTFFLGWYILYGPPFRNAVLNQVPENPLFWNPEEVLRKGHKGLPFPVENTGQLPTAHSTAATCKKDPKFIFFIHTATEHFRHRNIMRSCLRNTTFSKIFRWTTVFFVGLSADNATEKRVHEEASQHGDVVVLPYRDTYRNLTYKFVYGIKWTLENCPSVKYIIKLDDDFAVNLLRVMNYLDALPKANVSQFHCRVKRNTYPLRDVKWKWYLPEKLYPRKMFPPYCDGGSLMFNATVLQGLYNASFLVPFHPIDDVYVTGDASEIVGAQFTEINQLCSYFGNDLLGVTSGKLMFSQIHDEELRVSAWRNISEGLSNYIRTKLINTTKS